MLPVFKWDIMWDGSANKEGKEPLGSPASLSLLLNEWIRKGKWPWNRLCEWKGEGTKLDFPRRTISLKNGKLPVFHVHCFKTGGYSEGDPERELGHSLPRGWMENWRLTEESGILWVTGVPWLVGVLSGLFLLGLRDVSILGWVVTLMVKYDCLPFLLTKTGERSIFLRPYSEQLKED